MMKEYDGLTFAYLTKEDIENMTLIMKRAFDEDARIHLNEPTGGPDGYDNGEFLTKWGFHPDTTAYKVLLEDRVIGCVILWINNETNINYLGNVFIDPDLQNKSFGQKIWSFVEKEYPNTTKWCTDTPAFSKRNHHFYVNKCGFHIIRIENPMDKYEASYILEKKMNLSGQK